MRIRYEFRFELRHLARVLQVKSQDAPAPQCFALGGTPPVPYRSECSGTEAEKSKVHL